MQASFPSDQSSFKYIENPSNHASLLSYYYMHLETIFQHIFIIELFAMLTIFLSMQIEHHQKYNIVR